MESSVLPSEIILILAVSQPIVLPHSLITKILHKEEDQSQVQLTEKKKKIPHHKDTARRRRLVTGEGHNEKKKG